MASAFAKLCTAVFVFHIAALICADAPTEQQRRYSVGRTTRSFVDSTRQRWDGGGPRSLTSIVWYPAEASTTAVDWLLGPPDAPLFRLGRSAPEAPLVPGVTKHPLVVLSHGTGGSAAMLAWLGEHLAQAGYIVAAVDHHGNTASEPSPTAEGFMLWWERAIDLSRVIDHLLADAELGGRIDGARIGAAGFSLGGYTVLATAGARTSISQWKEFCRSPLRDSTCQPPPEYPDAFAEFERVRDRPDVRASLDSHHKSFRDTRIRAVVALAPVGSWITEESLLAMQIPVRIFVGKVDGVAPAATNARRVAELIPGARLSVLEGVGHYTFLALCTPVGRTQRPDLCEDESSVDRQAVHNAVAREAERFFNQIFGGPD
jgi:predicted dienelactone hydrolase